MRPAAALVAPYDTPATRSFNREPLRWSTLALGPPPPRDWAISHWLGMGHVTLLAGKGGIGKTLIAQQLGSALALGRPFVDEIERPRHDSRDRVLQRETAFGAAAFGDVAREAAGVNKLAVFEVSAGVDTHDLARAVLAAKPCFVIAHHFTVA